MPFTSVKSLKIWGQTWARHAQLVIFHYIHINRNSLNILQISHHISQLDIWTAVIFDSEETLYILFCIFMRIAFDGIVGKPILFSWLEIYKASTRVFSFWYLYAWQLMSWKLVALSHGCRKILSSPNCTEQTYTKPTVEKWKCHSWWTLITTPVQPLCNLIIKLYIYLMPAIWGTKHAQSLQTLINLASC